MDKRRISNHEEWYCLRRLENNWMEYYWKCRYAKWWIYII